MRRARYGVLLLALGVASAWLAGRLLDRSCEAASTGSSTAKASLRLPGAPPLPAETETQLAAALAAKGPSYRPHTRHLNADGSPKYTNRLILEDSPYLLQHAHNPVNWHPWGDEAFERARTEGKAVLLSVGYSTCHWCHVMEEESFEDPEIAEFLNRHYVAIKVDRERRPDVDSVYMIAVQALTGGGGWPMTVWLTPDRKPFYGGTYFPARDGDRGARIGFLSLLKRLEEIYAKEPEKVTSSAQEITSSIERASLGAHSEFSFSSEKLAAILSDSAKRYARIFDDSYGGFGRAPKFPQSVVLEFLLRETHRTGNRKLTDMVEATLDRMAKGGIYDHVGGGFHRYSTDREWLVPHFEKMLYDNALLVVAYLEGYQATGREDFARITRETLRYIRREMTSPEGAFYSATDADSEGVEGKFFLWAPEEIRAAIGPERSRWFDAYYGVTESGNFEGKNILHVADSLDAVAKRFGMEPAALDGALAKARDDLYRARQKRVPPFQDTKILTSWNGLMISAYARAALVLGDPDYAARAVKAADFVLSRMREGERLKRSDFQGRSKGAGFLDDYAFLEQAMLDLYEATFESRWLSEAAELQGILDGHFWDAQHGGYFLTPDDGEAMLTREKPSYDGAEPSGNSVALYNLARLAELTSDDRYRQRADETLAAFGTALEGAPTALAKMLSAIDFRLDAPKEIVLVKPDARASEEEMLARLRLTFLPNRVLTVATEGRDLTEEKKLVPLLEGRNAIGGKVTAYVCEAQVCKLPTTDPEVFAKQIATPGSAAR
jgi:uncharacterized protein YyaL (SSP411 family)